jgi:hypothetical protein
MNPNSISNRTAGLSHKTMRGALWIAGLALITGMTAWMTGCRVRVDKGANGEDKNVQVDTPFGGVHVNTDQTTAADLGLPVYPGAVLVRGDDSHKSADVHVGFGEWQLRVRAVSYGTPDKQDQVVEFYKKALGRYGNVITCKDGEPVGTPTVTTEGLSCDNDKDVNVDSGSFHTGDRNLQLKAGSKRHQHIVGFEDPADGQTRFALVAVDLPENFDNPTGKSD